MNCVICDDPDRLANHVYNVMRDGRMQQIRVCEPCSEEVDGHLVRKLAERQPWVPDRDTIGDAKFHQMREDGLI
jgi:hypothetical protein